MCMLYVNDILHTYSETDKLEAQASLRTPKARPWSAVACYRTRFGEACFDTDGLSSPSICATG
jgi:hypothetical protein